MRVRSMILAAHFQFETDTAGSRTVLRLVGELDVASSAVLLEELAQLRETSPIVLDLRGLEFIDSTGLGAIVKTHQQMRDAGRQLAVIQGDGQVRRMLGLTGLDTALTLIDSAEQALPS